MPAFMTHYAFGVEGWRQLPVGELKAAIRAHSAVYATGLAGPDILFYSPYEYVKRGWNLGRILHKYRTGAFLQAMYEETLRLDGEEREIAIAYLAGFIGHYSLDSAAHAFVYRVSRDEDPLRALGRHFRYEAAMDVMACEQLLGRNIHRIPQTRLLRMNHEERKICARLLSAACQEVFPDTDRCVRQVRFQGLLLSYYILTGLILDPIGIKEWFFHGCEKVYPGFTLYSPLMINDHRYGLTEKDWNRFYLRYRRGMRRFNSNAGHLHEALLAPGDPEKRRQLFQALGTWSYHGLYHNEAADREHSLQQLKEMGEGRKPPFVSL